MDTRRFWLMVLGAAWLLAWAASLAAFVVVDPVGGSTGPVRAFLGWQAVAALVALALWGVGRRWPKRSPTRRLAGLPLTVAALTGLAIGAAALYAQIL